MGDTSDKLHIIHYEQVLMEAWSNPFAFLGFVKFTHGLAIATVSTKLQETGF